MDVLQTCHPLGVPAVALFRKQTKKILWKHLIIFAFSRARGRWGHIFATTRSAKVLKKKCPCHFYCCSWGSVWCFSCFGVVVDTSWRKSPPSQIPLAESTHFGIIFPPTSSKFWRGRHRHFFLQDLGLPLLTVTKTCPHRPQQWQAIKRAQNSLAFP